MKYVPNALSLSRIPISVLLFLFALSGDWRAAAAMMALGLITDALDGMIARRFRVESGLGGNILEPVCDLVLATAAVLGLWLGGIWPLWIPLVIGILNVLLQVSHFTPFTRLKRHTFWIHPIFYVLVVFWAGLVIFYVAFGSIAVFLYGVVWGMIASAKKDRWIHWFQGPPQTT